MELREIPEEIRYCFAVMIDKMIYDMLVIFEDMISKTAIKILSKYYRVREDDLKQCLLNNDSPFVVGSIIVYHDGDRFIRRTTLLARVGNIYRKKLIPKLKKERWLKGGNLPVECVDEIFNTIMSEYG